MRRLALIVVVAFATLAPAAEAMPRLHAERGSQASATMSAAGGDSESGGSCRLEAWVPGAARPDLRETGITRIRAVRRQGGWSITGGVRGQWRIVVTRG